jgi:hypothetical protein
MNSNTSRNVFIGSWVLAFILITWASFHQGQGMPQPVRLIKTCAVWTILALVSEASPKLAGIMGMGMMIPLWYLTQAKPGTSPNATSASSAIGNIASGVITGGL